MSETSGGPHIQWIRAHLDYPHKDWCLIWPFATKRAGYGSFMQDSRSFSVHRYICEQVNGPPPSDLHVAAHSCNRGHEACVNPHHLSWKTNAGNQLDRVDRKGRRKRSKLTQEKADYIRTRAGQEPVEVTALCFDISESAVRQVQSGKTWTGQNRRRRVDLTVDQVLYIKRMNGVKRQQDIADELGVSLMTISRVITGRAYGHIQL